MTPNELLAEASTLTAALAGIDPSDPAAAEARLAGLDTRAFEAALRAAHAEGWATPKEAGGVRFGRVAKADPTLHGFSLDVVDMNGAAPGSHVHPRGELDLCLVLEGHPRFDGRAPGWVVYPPNSRHIPTVTGGRMLIAYFLPGGEIQFDR